LPKKFTNQLSSINPKIKIKRILISRRENQVMEELVMEVCFLLIHPLGWPEPSRVKIVGRIRRIGKKQKRNVMLRAEFR